MSKAELTTANRWLRRVSMTGLLGSTSVLAGSLAISIMTGSPAAADWFGPTSIVIAMFAMALSLTFVQPYPGEPMFRAACLAGIVACGIGWLLFQLEVIGDRRSVTIPFSVQLLLLSTHVVVLGTIVNVLLSQYHPVTWYNLIRYATIGGAGVAALLGFVQFWLGDMAVDWLWPLLFVGTLGVILGAGTVQAVHSRMEKRAVPDDQRALPVKAALFFHCPICGTKQSHRPGPIRRCIHCRQAMLIELNEPRCECGYLIYRLATSTCPECGRDLSDHVERGRESQDQRAFPINSEHDGAGEETVLAATPPAASTAAADSTDRSETPAVDPDDSR